MNIPRHIYKIQLQIAKLGYLYTYKTETHVVGRSLLVIIVFENWTFEKFENP